MAGDFLILDTDALVFMIAMPNRSPCLTTLLMYPDIAGSALALSVSTMTCDL